MYREESRLIRLILDMIHEILVQLDYTVKPPSWVKERLIRLSETMSELDRLQKGYESPS
jgi:hypothetical protein